MTPAELARMLRMGRDRILGMIRRGELPAINTAPARCGRPRYVILPDHLAHYLSSHLAAEPKPSPRRRKRSQMVDYFPGD
jgi:hypothetical protein